MHSAVSSVNVGRRGASLKAPWRRATEQAGYRAFTAVLALSVLATVLSGCAKRQDHPHIILILADDMGYGDLSAYNPQSKIATPHLDRLAREGMRFTDAHASGAVCHPSRYGLMTGTYPFRTDVSVWPTRPLIRDDQVTLASLLRASGYETAMVGKWHLGFDERGYDQRLAGGPIDRGFDSFFGLRASTDIPPYFYVRNDHAEAPPTAHIEASRSDGWSPIQGGFWREGDIAPGLALEDVLPKLTDEAVSVVRAHAATGNEQPLFLYLALTAPHTPWLPAPEFSGRSGAGMYGDFTMMVDAMIGRLLEALDETGMGGEAVVVFASDNGPVWYPEDVARTGHDSVGGLRGMKSSNWEGGHRVPFLVRWPGRVAAGSTSDETIAFTDLMATVAGIVGATLPDGAGLDSFSFLPVLLGSQPAGVPVRPSLVVGQSIRSGPWKWIEGHEPIAFYKPELGVYPATNRPAGQLYNLTDDPSESHDLAANRPDVVARLSEELARIRAGVRTRP